MGNYKKVMLVGNGMLACSIAINLLRAGHIVFWKTDEDGLTERSVLEHLKDLRTYDHSRPDQSGIEYIQEYRNGTALAIVITEEDEMMKKNLIKLLDGFLDRKTTIAVNTESFFLSSLYAGCRYPDRVIGLNWALPAHTTAFLELITDGVSDLEKAGLIKTLAENCWRKDPYLLRCGYSIRARLMAAIIREALFLVEHGFASVDDIDRANRNDAGYYLPFAGNCRYMDLMGTYAYGVVMKDLNGELSTAGKVPVFFDKLIQEEKLGMDKQEGFYGYTRAEVESWKAKSRKFSYEIRKVMDKYPFGYLTRDQSVQTLSTEKVNE